MKSCGANGEVNTYPSGIGITDGARELFSFFWPYRAVVLSVS